MTTLSFSACSPAPQAIQNLPTPAVAAPTAAASAIPPQTTALVASAEETTKAGIQTTIDRYSKALRSSDAALLDSTIDPKSGPFRRIVVGRFEAMQKSALASAMPSINWKITKVESLALGFVRATLDRGDVTDVWTFREVDGKWLLSEPSTTQLGKTVTTKSEHFTFRTYLWADDVNADIMQLMEQARAIVEKKLGRAPDTKPLVSILPTVGSGPAMNSNFVAFYSPTAANRGPDRIFITTPTSFTYGGYDTAGGWKPWLLQTLTHEYTHLVNNRSFTPIHRLPKWMTEGLAEYISDSSRPGMVALALERDALIPLLDPAPVDSTSPQDLEHWDLLQRDTLLAYAEGYSLVHLIVERHEGLTGFWKLAAAYDKEQNLDKALQKAYGISYQDFDREWREWLKENA